MPDGYRLPVSVWRPHDDIPVRAVVLALHGLNDYRNAFAAVGPALAAHGIVTYAYDQRGFGETQAAGIWHGGWRLAQDMRAMAKLLRSAYPGQPLYALGESLGGAVLLGTLQQTPPAIDGMAGSIGGILFPVYAGKVLDHFQAIINSPINQNVSGTNQTMPVRLSGLKL